MQPYNFQENASSKNSYINKNKSEKLMLQPKGASRSQFNEHLIHVEGTNSSKITSEETSEKYTTSNSKSQDISRKSSSHHLPISEQSGDLMGQVEIEIQTGFNQSVQQMNPHSQSNQMMNSNSQSDQTMNSIRQSDKQMIFKEINNYNETNSTKEPLTQNFIPRKFPKSERPKKYKQSSDELILFDENCNDSFSDDKEEVHLSPTR